MGLGSSGYAFYAGASAPGSAPFRVTQAGGMTAQSGLIGGWTISAGELAAGGSTGARLDATNRRFLLGAATAPLTGVGVFLGLDGSDWEFRCGDPAGEYVHWDGSVLTIQGAVIQSPGAGSDPALLGWNHDMVFSATDADTVAWTSGTIRLQNGETYSIGAGNTGNMLAVTYVYLDTAVSLVALQTTTSASAAVGANRILVAVADAASDGTEAPFQVYGGSGGVGVFLTAAHLAANTITGNEIAANTITATQVASLSFSGKTAVFDTGSVGGWTMASGRLSSGGVEIRATEEQMRFGSATAPLAGNGIFIGKDGSDYEFRVGDPAGEYIHWDGSAFEINASQFTASNPVFDGSMTIFGGLGSSKGGVYVTGASDGGIITAQQLDAISGIGEFRITSALSYNGGKIQVRAFTPGPPSNDSGYVDLLSATTTTAGVVTASLVASSLTLSGIASLGFASGATVTNILTNTVVWNPGSIAAFASTTTTVTVTGAAVGDAVFVANEFQADDKALHLFARVTATNTVTLHLHNTYTGGALDPASRTLRVVVVKF